MARTRNAATAEKRYQKLLSDPKHRPKKQKDVRRHDKLVNLAILAALIYGGTYLIPQKDKEDLAEMLGTLPGELAAAAPQAAVPQQGVSLTEVLSALMPDRPATVAAGDQPAVRTAGGDTAAAPLLSMSDFPAARDSWQRTDYTAAEAAAQALLAMDDLPQARPVRMLPVAQVRDRKAAAYDDGANLRFLILVEVGRPAPPPAADAGPAPSVMLDIPGALSVPRAEQSVADLPSQAPSRGLIARTRLESDGPRTVQLAGITFTDLAQEPAPDLVDLRAELPGERVIHIRGRAPLTVIADFLSRADLTGLGVRS